MRMSFVLFFVIIVCFFSLHSLNLCVFAHEIAHKHYTFHSIPVTPTRTEALPPCEEAFITPCIGFALFSNRGFLLGHFFCVIFFKGVIKVPYPIKYWTSRMHFEGKKTMKNIKELEVSDKKKKVNKDFVCLKAWASFRKPLKWRLGRFLVLKKR